MEYCIEKVEIKEGCFYQLTRPVDFCSAQNLVTGDIIKIEKADKTGIDYIEFYLKHDGEYTFYHYSIGTSPGEAVEFDYFVGSLEQIGCPELIEANIPKEQWGEDYLLRMVEFLETRIDDLQMPLSRQELTKLLIKEINKNPWPNDTDSYHAGTYTARLILDETYNKGSGDKARIIFVDKDNNEPSFTAKAQEVIELLEELQDGTKDPLGENCQKAIDLLRIILCIRDNKNL